MNKIKSKVFGIIIAVAIISIACAGIESETSNKQEKIEELIATYYEQGKFHGTALVSYEGKVIYKKGFGFANREWDIPNSNHTKFRLASVSKQFTALLVMQLVETGKIDLQEKVATYLPNYPKPQGDQITIHHLLTHTAAIPRSEVKYNERHDVPTLLNSFKDLPLDRTPGELYRYSNEGYILLGYILEQITGKSYQDLIQVKIFDPAGMKNSGYDNHYQIIKYRASGYSQQGKNYKNAPYIDMSNPYAAGSLYATVEDLFLWDEALRNNALLSAKNFNEMIKPQIETGYRFYGYGFSNGLHRVGISNIEEQAHWHTGGIEGFRTLILRVPASNSCIVLLSNSEHAFLQGITESILAILNDVEYKFPSKSIAEAVFEKMEAEGIDKGLAFYEEIRNSTQYLHNERELITAGYDFFQAGKLEEAAALFKITTEAIPLASNAFDSYGEALLALGKKEEAIVNYKKSIELDPKNENGVTILKELGVNIDDLIHQVSIETLKSYVGRYGNESKPDEFPEIIITILDGVLYFQDNRFNYSLFPISDETFVHQARGAEVEFTLSKEGKILLKANGVDRYQKLSK